MRAIMNRGFYIFTPFFTAIYNQERLILETICVVNKKLLQKNSYSKASRYTALRSTDLGDTRFLIGSQNT